MSHLPLTIPQNSRQPPAQPTYVLRGHSAQIHAVHFSRQNSRLISADADGWVVSLLSDLVISSELTRQYQVVWDVPIKRPVVVWQAHKGSVLGARTWDDDKIITCVKHFPQELARKC